MRGWSDQRWGAAAGVGFVVLAAISAFAAGSYPKFDDPAGKIVTFYADHHKAVLLSVVLSGIAGPLFIWLIAMLALAMRAAGQGALAVTAFGAAVAGTALAMASDAVNGGLAHATRAAPPDPGFVRGAYQLSAFFFDKTFWFAALLAAATGLAAWRAMPRWYAWTSLAAAVLLALGGISVKQSGFFGAVNTMAYIGFFALLVWTLATSFLLWRLAPGAEEAPAPATAPR